MTSESNIAQGAQTGGTALFSKDTVTIFAPGRDKPLMITRQYADFNNIELLLRAGNFEAALLLADRAQQLAITSDGAFEVKDGVVYFDGITVHHVICERILTFQEEGLPYEPLKLFLGDLLHNPNPNSIADAYGFLEHKNLPVTEDGCFLAYKSVRSDFFSKYRGAEEVEVSTDGGETWEVFGGHIPNKPGSIVRIARELVDNDHNKECSRGLHVGCLEYAGPSGWYHSAGDRIVIVKVRPRNIVSVPNDEDRTKMRVCEYEVVGLYEEPIAAPLVTPTGGIVERVVRGVGNFIGRVLGTLFGGNVADEP